jgi:CheY-like chemotaxis protein
MAFSPIELLESPAVPFIPSGASEQYSAAAGVRGGATWTADRAGGGSAIDPREGRKGLRAYRGDTEPQADEQQGPPRCGRRVLVVDDNRDLAESLALVLRLWGHEVAVAFDGPEALAAARAQAPEVMFLDIGLPLLDGFEVAKQLRSEPEMKRMRIIAVTGYGRDEDVRRSREVGIDLHLTKPVDPLVLQRLLVEEQ